MRRSAQRWLVGAALVVGAGLVTAITPTDDDLTAAFVMRPVGEAPATGRTLSASMVSTTLAERVVSAEGDWSAGGNWLVVELVASAPQTELDAEIALAALHIDGRVFHASERVPDSLLDSRLHVGTPTAGILAFELADDLRSGRAELRLTTTHSTPSLDDVVALPVSLDSASSAATLELAPSTVGAP